MLTWTTVDQSLLGVITSMLQHQTLALALIYCPGVYLLHIKYYVSFLVFRCLLLHPFIAISTFEPPGWTETVVFSYNSSCYHLRWEFLVQISVLITHFLVRHHLESWVQFLLWAPQYEMDTKLLESIQRRATIKWKGLEGKPYEKELKSLVLFTRHWGETSMWFAAPSHREDKGFSLCWPVTGLKRMTWSGVEEGLGWISGGGSSPKGCLGTSTCSPGNWLQCQAWQHLRSISKMFSGMWCGFGVVLCRARTWAWWSLWLPFNSVYVILLMYTVSVTHVFSWTFTGFGRDLHCEQIWRNRLAKIIFLSP